MSVQAEIVRSIYSGFVDHQGVSLEAYRPKLLVNDHEKGQKVLTSIINELNGCDAFFFSVAFITQSGVTVLLNTLKELEERGIQGKILASQYLNFTNPEALRRLLQFKNVELRMVVDGNLHAKGYIFRKAETYSLVVGSSNLTQEALGYNKEWNVKVSSMGQGSLIQDTLQEFQRSFDQAEKVNENWLQAYEDIYRRYKPVFHSKEGQTERVRPLFKIMPNRMQVQALNGIQRIRENGGDRALLISATGTGKTYLAAFDVEKVRPKKFLFLVHREQILDQAMESFQDVLGHGIETGKLTGRCRETEAQYLFSTVQTLSKSQVLERFASDAFDYVVLDETHRSGAESYQRILQHLQPEFLLGMTATPERTDGCNIYQDYGYNIAYEIRLQEALQENMLCPFHYFGVMEIMVDGKVIQEDTDFRHLVAEERISHILEKVRFYGYYGKRVKGLVFCSSVREAIELSQKFNLHGYKTMALSGSDSQEAREEAIERLEQEQMAGALDYIFTVDIFNEGVDIPSINQVIMLRPTQSAIIFVQQLGRGLRKHPEKDYVVVIDFIGNYRNNFMIPMALSGDRSYNKDTVRRYVLEGNRVIPGCSTINFEAVAKKRIFEAIDNANFSDIRLIKESYQNLKYQLGRIPSLKEFELYGSIDVTRIFDNNSLGSYHLFLKKYEKEYQVRFSPLQEKFIEFISKKLASGKRIHELLLLKGMMSQKENLIHFLRKCLFNDYGIEIGESGIWSVVNVLTGRFASGTSRDTYKDCVFLEEAQADGEYRIATDYRKLLEDSCFKDKLLELLDFGIERNRKCYGSPYSGTSFQLYQKYTYEDVCRLLEWEKAEVPLNIGGYKFDRKTKTYPVFINYEKPDDISDSTNYEDRFLSSGELIAISKSGRTPESEDVVQAYRAGEDGVRMYLFVRKNKDDHTSKEFYFLGRIHTIGKPHPIIMKNTNKNAVEIRYRLEVPVREELYEYLVG
ncbi:DUF3427 domain-containing protein [Anaerotalea alkaliphila]|uniref:DEAD/DEAH box helicase n=1 Tax=Anaerotalea alkaliphila TaxID=2662126 RepID=A0A7X5HX66_9FIRM|nr:DEAD/DEAH box helicase [Anaerotalea alkaliphila]NDL68258.1 DEAD/DEAH box helicase [Anaerotalea alkaliphila]